MIKINFTKKVIPVLIAILIMSNFFVNKGLAQDVSTNEQLDATQTTTKQYRETKLKTKLPNVISIGDWSINVDSKGKLFSYISSYSTLYDCKKKIKAIDDGNAIVSYTAKGKSKITYLPQHGNMTLKNSMLSGKSIYLLSSKNGSRMKKKIEVFNSRGKIKKSVTYNTKGLLTKKNKLVSNKAFYCNKLIMAGKNKVRVLYSIKSEGNLVQGGIALFDLKTGKMENECILGFLPVEVDNRYIYGVDGNNLASSGNMMYMIADRKTGKIVNTIASNYSMSLEDKQKVVGGEAFGDYFYDFNNGKILIANPSGFYYGKVTADKFTKISDLSDSKYYKGASDNNKYVIKEIKIKSRTEFYVLYCIDADGDVDNVLAKYTAE